MSHATEILHFSCHDLFGFRLLIDGLPRTRKEAFLWSECVILLDVLDQSDDMVIMYYLEKLERFCYDEKYAEIIVFH